VRNQRWRPGTGNGYEITHISACIHDSIDISTDTYICLESSNMTTLDRMSGVVTDLGGEGRQTPLSKQGDGSHQHGLWPCAVTMLPFVPHRSIRLPLLKILDPPLVRGVVYQRWRPATELHMKKHVFLNQSCRSNSKTLSISCLNFFAIMCTSGDRLIRYSVSTSGIHVCIIASLVYTEWGISWKENRKHAGVITNQDINWQIKVTVIFSLAWQVIT